MTPEGGNWVQRNQQILLTLILGWKIHLLGWKTHFLKTFTHSKDKKIDPKELKDPIFSK